MADPWEFDTRYYDLDVDCDDGYDGDDLFIHRGGRRGAPVCYECGAVCGWVKTGGKWRLADADRLHICDPKERQAALADEVEDLD